MRFEPVHLKNGLGDRISVTVLRKFDLCPRSAYLYAKHRDTDAKTPEMLRGTAFHLTAQRCIETMLENGEIAIPPELAKAIMDETLAEVPVPIHEHDRLREAAYRWAAETAVDPSSVIACETLMMWEVGGYQIRGRIDFAELIQDGALCVVRDWKTSPAAPSFEEIARKRPDGTLAAKSAQLVLYCLLLAYGVPVRVEPCERCDGGRRAVAATDGGSGCEDCLNHRYIEIPEPFPLASRAQAFEAELVFPAIEDSEGKMLRRPVSLTRLELDEYRQSIEALTARLRNAEETGDWPAVISDAACGECPCPAECPIPAELRDHRGTINTVEQASEAAEVLDRRQAVDAAIRKELKAFAKAHGIEIPFGRDKRWVFGYQETTRIPNKDAMFVAMERAVKYGEPFNREDFIKPVKSTPFKVETIPEGSNGSE